MNKAQQVTKTFEITDLQSFNHIDCGSPILDWSDEEDEEIEQFYCCYTKDVMRYFQTMIKKEIKPVILTKK